MVAGMARAKRKLAAAVTLGRLGAQARYRGLSAEERRVIARQAAQARWTTVSPEERSRLGRRAVQARWAKVRAKVTRKKAAKD
jgi:hypothetical protein